MNVQVIHGLSAVGLAVYYESGAFFGASQGSGYLLGPKKQIPQNILLRF
jgi:hypothetical protein